MIDNDKRILSDEQLQHALARYAADFMRGNVDGSALDRILAHEAARREREAADTALLRRAESVLLRMDLQAAKRDTDLSDADVVGLLDSLRARIGGG